MAMAVATSRVCRICLEEEEGTHSPSTMMSYFHKSNGTQPSDGNGQGSGGIRSDIRGHKDHDDADDQQKQNHHHHRCEVEKGDEDGGQGKGRLISPCLCKGSSEYVHESCLTKWRLMNFNRKDKRDVCTVCLQPFATRYTARGICYRLVYYAAMRAGALAVLIPLGSIASILLPLLPRRGNYEIVDGKVILASSHYGVDLTGLDVTPWSSKVFKLVLPESIIDDINSIILFPESGMRLALKGNFIPGIIWGLARLGSIGFYLSYFLNGSIVDFVHISFPTDAFPRIPWLTQGVNVLFNYLFFCASLRAIRTPSSRRGLGMFMLSTIIGLLSVYSRLLAMIRGVMLRQVPTLALLEIGELSSR